MKRKSRKKNLKPAAAAAAEDIAAATAAVVVVATLPCKEIRAKSSFVVEVVVEVVAAATGKCSDTV